MTADQKRSAEGTDIPKDGASVRFKMFNTTGVVVTRTVENPPRLVVRTADAAGPFDYVAAIAEVEVIEKRQTPFEKITGGILADFWKAWATSAIQYAVPKRTRDAQKFEPFGHTNDTALDGQYMGPTAPTTPAPATHAPTLIWSPQNGRGDCATSCRRFVILRLSWCGHYQATDMAERNEKGDRVKSPHFGTIEAAKKWCEERVPKADAPKIENVRGVEWDQTNKFGATGSVCKRFRFYMEPNPAGGMSYRGADDWVKHDYTSGPADKAHRYSPLGTLDDVKEWCEDRNEWNVNNTNGVSRLEDKSIPF